jgi:hypothetical protein
MHIELLVEEPSCEAALDNLLPRILGDRATFQIHSHQGKQDLLVKLPSRLRGYAHWLPDDWYIVVLVDEDRQDCLEIKQDLERHALQAGLYTRSNTNAVGRFQVINRLAIEELEAWFFGDVFALHQAFPRVPETLRYQRPYRDPDGIHGGTFEALERLLVGKNYFGRDTGTPKIEVARRVSRYMDPSQSRSKSFQVFRDGLLLLLRI